MCSETKPTINKVLPMVTKQLLIGLEEDENNTTAIKALKQ